MLFKQRNKIAPVSKVDLFQTALMINAELKNLQHQHPEFGGAYAGSAGRHISVRYHRTQEPFLLDYATALRYLEWIRSGHCGRHTEMLTQKEKDPA